MPEIHFPRGPFRAILRHDNTLTLLIWVKICLEMTFNYIFIQEMAQRVEESSL